jgi:1,4-dihydroxy-2-naphthoate phytyltransferase
MTTSSSALLRCSSSSSGSSSFCCQRVVVSKRQQQHQNESGGKISSSGDNYRHHERRRKRVVACAFTRNSNDNNIDDNVRRASSVLVASSSSTSSTIIRSRRRRSHHQKKKTTHHHHRAASSASNFRFSNAFDPSSSYTNYSFEKNENGPDSGSSSSSSRSSNNKPQLTQSELWWRCAKLPMYSVAVIPVVVAAASASYLNLIDPKIAGASAMNLTLRLLLGACSVIAWLNISNDAWDYQTGVDSGNRKPESIVNLLNGDAKAAHVTSAFFLIAGVVTLLPLFANAPLVAPSALLLAIGCGYAYQAPPLRLSYKGLGEPLCFTAFGPLATSAFFAVFAGANLPSFLNVPPLLWVNAWMVGVTTSMILFASHLHQREGDEISGKMSPCVRFGVDFCVSSIQHVVSAYYALIATFVSCGWLPSVAGAMIFITYPLARAMQNYALDNMENEKMLFKTKYFAVRWHVAHGVALAFGLWLSRRLAVPF